MPTLYAHRGASAELPENTLPAFARAFDVGATALEMDVHLTADGHVVVAHDSSGTRLAGVARDIRKCALAEVKSWDVGRSLRARRPLPESRYEIPTLDEVLGAFSHAPINVDIKQHDDATVGAVLQVVRRRRAADRVLLTSFDPGTLGRVRALGYEGPTGLGRGEVLALVGLPEVALRLRPLTGRAAQIPTGAGPLALDRRSLIDKAHRLGILVHYWTIDDRADAARLLALGADGIMTDDPAAIAPAFARAAE